MKRDIDDANSGRMTLAGAAEFRTASRRLLYCEEGELVVPGRPPMPASRRYVWESANGWINIRFEDGRPFHGFPLGAEQPEAVHHCPPDRYAVAYDFRNWPQWSATWRVNGPRKNYTLVSHYWR